jgi:hypothetical protein
MFEIKYPVTHNELFLFKYTLSFAFEFITPKRVRLLPKLLHLLPLIRKK